MKRIKLFEDIDDYAPVDKVTMNRPRAIDPYDEENWDEKEDTNDIVYVMSMDQRWTEIYKVPKSFYDELIARYGSLQRMYDNYDEEIMNRLFAYPTLEPTDGFISY